MIARLAALYDIHGNLAALEAALDDVRQADVDQIVIGGDVLPGPMPCETLARLLDLDIPVPASTSNVVTTGVRARLVSSFRENDDALLKWVLGRVQALWVAVIKRCMTASERS